MTTTSAFTCNAATFTYSKTRRGVNAVCNILKGGVIAAVLHDKAEEIVATVDFASTQLREEFLAEARANGFDKVSHNSDDYAISEYAREMTMTAEEVYSTAART